MRTLCLGCYVKNDFFFKEKSGEPTPYMDSSSITWTDGAPTSAITCATACYKSGLCTQGWSYQQATARCLFVAADIGTEHIDKLQPTGHIMDTERTVGWATGLKACTETGQSILSLFCVRCRGLVLMCYFCNR